jgi:hypothetical protein
MQFRPKLDNLTSITFQQGSRNITTVENVIPTQNTTINISDTNLANSNFILADYKANISEQFQSINSDIKLLENTTILGERTILSAILANGILLLNTFNAIISNILTNGQLLIGSLEMFQ